ncbi:hypothetical protein BDQ17DRAFT_1397279 [Cyathus striatus]|nr:hypothetical protein BDQ17DRAFT_1397279 [Cyathus striatus]
MLSRISFGLLLAFIHISTAIDVFLYPTAYSSQSNLSPEDGSAVLSRHLGLERFEPLRDASEVDYYVEEPFVGQGSRNALLLTVDKADAGAVVPSSPPSSSIDSLASVISTYLNRARHAYSIIYSSERHAWQLDNIDTLTSFFDSTAESAFAALELSNIAEMRQKFGISSSEYNEAVYSVRSFLEHVLDDDTLTLAILTYEPKTHETMLKREASPQQSQSPLPAPEHPSPQEPIGSISTCFASEDACNNGTNSCSGRGKCMQATKSGRSCFVCTCSATKSGEGNNVKTENWAGQSCERKDISSPFALLAGTAVTLFLLIIGSVTLLYSVGDQALPSTLMATAVTAKRE